jgi:hypothetical protein
MAAMSPGLRKFVLTAHVTCSVGWLGSVASFVALALVGLESGDSHIVSAVYVAAAVLGQYVIVPFSFAALLTGVVVSVATEWGLVRHYWVLVKFLLTIGATALLLLHMQPVNRLALAAAGPGITSPDILPLRIQILVDACLGLLVLLAATALSVYKPWGLTAWTALSVSDSAMKSAAAHRRVSAARPWGLYVLLVMTGFVVIVILVHLAGGGLHHH